MATRINMMKLLHEMHGLAQITNRRPAPRPSGPLALQIRPLDRRAAAKRRRTIRVDMQDPPDIPNPVAIKHVSRPAVSAARVSPR
jgi:hypothetical protein